MISRLRATAWIHVVLLVLAALTVFPIFFMIVNSLQDGNSTASSPWWFTSWHLLWSNYRLAFDATASSYARSAIITAASVVGVLAFASLSAYAFAKLEFWGKQVLFVAVFGLLLVPSFLTLIPLLVEIKDFRLVNTVWGLIFPYVAGGQAFAIFILRSFFGALPDELFESARIDGASEVRIFLRIVMPLSAPVLVTIALINVLAIWSDFVLPSLVLHDPHQTLAVSIVNFAAPITAPQINAFNIQLAAFVLSSVPLAILFSFLMRYFVRGITSGAIKM